MTEFNPKLSFGIIGSRGFYLKLLDEYKSFDKDHVSPIHAINCALTSWHLTDWIFSEFMSPLKIYQDIYKEKVKNGKTYEIIISALRQYQDEVIKECPELIYMYWIANGSKHCILRNAHMVGKTLKYEGDFAYQDFSRRDFDVDRFEIETNDGEKIDFENALIKTINYWSTILEKYDPE